MEEKKEKRVLTIELDNNVKKVSITGLGDDNRAGHGRPARAALSPAQGTGSYNQKPIKYLAIWQI